MIRIRKIRAYTLTEVLIVLALTAVVAALSFSALGFVKRSLSLIDSNYSFANDYRNLERDLTLDLNSAWDVRAITKGQLKLENPVNTISYKIESGHLIKNQDTIYSGSIDWTLFYKGAKTISGPVDALKLTFSEGNPSGLFVSKTQSTKDKLESLGD